MKKAGSCPGCDRGLSRRRAVGQMSAAIVAAMAGVPLVAGTAECVPVSEATGTPTGADEHTYPLPASDGVTIDRDSQVIIVRFQHHAYAFNLACPHENTALRWKQALGHFQCPRHQSQYQPDGTFISGRATRNMDRFGVRLTAAGLVVDLNQFYRSDQQPKEWSAATVALD